PTAPTCPSVRRYSGESGARDRSLPRSPLAERPPQALKGSRSQRPRKSASGRMQASVLLPCARRPSSSRSEQSPPWGDHSTTRDLTRPLDRSPTTRDHSDQSCMKALPWLVAKADELGVALSVSNVDQTEPRPIMAELGGEFLRITTADPVAAAVRRS